jgi:hypothetical protein
MSHEVKLSGYLAEITSTREGEGRQVTTTTFDTDTIKEALARPHNKEVKPNESIMLEDMNGLSYLVRKDALEAANAPPPAHESKHAHAPHHRTAKPAHHHDASHKPEPTAHHPPQAIEPLQGKPTNLLGLKGLSAHNYDKMVADLVASTRPRISEAAPDMRMAHLPTQRKPTDPRNT